MAEQTQLGLLGNLGNQISNLGIPGQLGLLSTGLSLLENRPLGESIRTGLGAFGGLQQINQQQKQREAVNNLLASGSFTDMEKQLISASGQPVATALSIQNRKRTSTAPLSAIGKIRQDLQKKLKDLKELPKTANANIKNALFVGSTAELQKMLNKKSVETNVERKKENENFEGKNITPEKKDTKD